jgi:hypothetical protein
MKRALIAAAAVVALLAGVSTAAAAIGKGKFAGKTAVGDPLGFKVDSKNRVYSFYFQGVTLKCTDGDSFDSPSKEKPDTSGATEIRTPKSSRFTIDSKNRWGFQARNSAEGNGYDVSGKFSSQDKSKGTFSIFARFDENNTPDPKGSVSCSSGDLKFTVKRQVARQ